MTAPKPNASLDNMHLANALAEHRAAMQVIDALLRENRQTRTLTARQLSQLGEINHALAMQGVALSEMQVIRIATKKPRGTRKTGE